VEIKKMRKSTLLLLGKVRMRIEAWGWDRQEEKGPGDQLFMPCATHLSPSNLACFAPLLSVIFQAA
jgi:hypothetical protein